MVDLRFKPRVALCALALALAGATATTAGELRPVAPSAYSAYCMGVTAERDGRLAEAVEWFKKALTFDPRSAECHVRLGTLYSGQLHNPRVGRTHFDKALELSPGNFHARYGIAKQLLRNGKHEEAAEQIQAAIKNADAEIDGDLLARAYTDLATSAELRGANRDALAYCSKAAEKSSSPVYILVRLAFLHRAMGEHEEAVDALLAVKRLVPTYAKVLRELSKSYKTLGKWREALDELVAYMKHREGPGERAELLSEAAALATRAGLHEFAHGLREKMYIRMAARLPAATAKPKASADMGLALASVGQFERAAPYLRKAIEGIDDESVRLRLRAKLASAYEQLRRFDEAAEQLTECIKAVDPKDSILYRTDLCSVQEAAGKHADAEDTLKSILAIPGFEATGHAELGLFYDRRGKTDAAVGQLRQAIKLAPGRPSIRYRVHLSLALSDAGRHQQAEQALTEAREVFPDNPSVNNALAWHYAERGIKLDEALVLVRKAMKSQPTNPYYIDTLGWIHFKQGRNEAALSELRRAATLSRDGVIWEHLGDVYMALGRHEEAKKRWLQSLEFDPGLKSVRKKLDTLDTSK